MRFKGTKSDVMKRVGDVIQGSAYVDLSNIDYLQTSQIKVYVKQQIEAAIKSCLQASLYELINNIYTEEEFEDDIGLSKNETKI